MMELCHHYRSCYQKQKKFSPTKLKQMEAKLKLFDINNDKKSKTGDNNQRMTVYFGH